MQSGTLSEEEDGYQHVNILVTVDGNENLTASAPVDPEEIEAVMAG